MRKENKHVCWICGSTEASPKCRPVFYTDADGERRTALYHTAAEHQERWRHFCPACKAAEDNRLAKERAELARLKKSQMFERAMQILEGQRLDMYELREAIDAVKGFLDDNPDRFDSSYEMIAAIVLIQNRVRCKPQQKVGRYQVDFILPDELVVLEIDGFLHKGRGKKDSERDKEIRRTLGPEWEVVRIDTAYLEQNAMKLVEAIRKICERRIFGSTSGVYRQTGD